MEEKDLISVIIPVLNGEQYIKACLENILNQTYKNIEIIVVDDGCTDKTVEIAKRYPIKLISLDKNMGLSFARNKGLDLATGKFVHFMDVDDSINDDYYTAMSNAIRSTGADVACGGMINEARPQKAQRFEKLTVYSTVKTRLEATYVGKIGYVWRYLYSIDFLKKHNLRFLEGRLMEDLMFSLPALYFAEKLVVVPGAEYRYRHQENSIMTRKDAEHVKKRREDRKHAKKIMHDFAKKHNFKIPGVTTGRLRYVIKKWFGY